MKINEVKNSAFQTDIAFACLVMLLSFEAAAVPGSSLSGAWWDSK